MVLLLIPLKKEKITKNKTFFIKKVLNLGIWIIKNGKNILRAY